MAIRHGRGVVVALALLASACSNPASFSVFVTFPDQAALDRARQIEILALVPGEQQGCVELQAGTLDPAALEAEARLTIELGADASPGSLMDVGPGRRLFYARAHDDQQQAFLRGCTEALTGGAGVQQVRIDLEYLASPCEQDAQCDDGNVCTAGRCAAGSCTFDPVAAGTGCDDGLFCTVSDGCDGAGGCTGAERDCSALDSQCNRGVCSEDSDLCVVAPADEGQTCDDGLFCTQGETCQAGNCSGPVQDCEDGNPCTRGTCDEVDQRCNQRLVPVPNAEGPPGDPTCSDGLDNDCDAIVDTADPDCVACVSHLACDDGNPCTINTCEDSICRASLVAAGSDCDDGLFCNGPDSCNGAGVCLSVGNPCPQTECNQCQAATGSCFDPAGTACSLDGITCTIDECDGAGACAHTPDDGRCGGGGGGGFCAPACSGDDSGCVQRPNLMNLSCDDPVQLPAGSSCDLTLEGGTSAGQAVCLACSAWIGRVNLDASDFGPAGGPCELNGWQPADGPCFDRVDNCLPALDRPCCTTFDDWCEPDLFGQPVLRTDRVFNCGLREWRIEKHFDFGGVTAPEVCFDAAHNGIDNRSGFLLFVSDASHPLEQVSCLVGQLNSVPAMQFETYCAALPAWAEDNPDVTVSVLAHAHNFGQVVYLDNIFVKGSLAACPVETTMLLDEDFVGCLAGWNLVMGNPDCTPVNCDNQPQWLPGVGTAFGQLIIETVVDTRPSERIRACFGFGDNNTSNASLELLFNTGSGYRSAWRETGNFGADRQCRQACLVLSDIDPAAGSHPALGLRFVFDAFDGELGLYHLRVEGERLCRADPQFVDLTVPVEVLPGSYSFAAEDVYAGPLDAEIRCEWTLDPTVNDRTQVRFQQP